MRLINEVERRDKNDTEQRLRAALTAELEQEPMRSLLARQATSAAADDVFAAFMHGAEFGNRYTVAAYEKMLGRLGR